MADQEREILTLREASEFLNCHPSTVYRLVKSSQIPAFRLGGSWRFVKPELRRWIRGMTEWPGSEGDQPARANDGFGSKMTRPSPPSRRQVSQTSAGAASMGRGRRLGRRM
jgi:excisionase family DNA binding protein